MIKSFIIFLLSARVVAAQPPHFDSYVDSVLREFNVPGVSVAIVKDGKVLLARGYGVRTLGQTTPVDARTNFGIASNTKLFTATALALLVEQGKLKWDDRVIQHLPTFAMSDPYVTREMTIRDLLVHRSGLGLGAGDLLWWPASTYDRKEIVRRLRFIPLATSFRTAYAYDNVLYSVAGEVIEAVSGQTWEQFIEKRILAPAGMTNTTVLHSSAAASGNVASTHAEVNGRLTRVPPMTSDNTNPAGGINSNADDMAKWLIVQLDSGRLASGTRLFAPATTTQLWELVTPIPIGSSPPELEFLKANFSGYGLGVFLRDYRGRKLVQHTGGLPGYLSKVAMIPELRLGVAILTNQESSSAFNSIAYRVLDHFMGAEPVDYPRIYRAIASRTSATNAAALKGAVAARAADSRPSLPLVKYAGVYTDPWYGEVAITLERGKLSIRFAHTPELSGELEHWQYDTFIARWKERELRADAYVTFALNPDGTVDQVKMRAVSPDTDFSFDFQDLLLRPATGNR
ncbi:MAG TPA: serine hydrolase [Gemmatimonadaceae bacterium]|jgi:CubicO group peptidase (beta-lactamase class C family)